MNKHEYNNLAKFEKSYWWHKGKINLVESVLQKNCKTTDNLKILDVGCGTGEVMCHLSKYGEVYGIDPSQDAVDYCSERGITNVTLGDINQTNQPFLEQAFDVIVALDVLEHVQDDMLAMQKIHSMLKPTGIFIASVPAHKFLWSTHDEALQHKRRYHKYELTKKLKDCNFEIIKNTFFVSTPFPVILMYRAITNFLGRDAYPKTTYVILPAPLNNILYKILKMETVLIKYVNLPFGVSLVVAAKKRTNANAIC